MPLTPSIGLSVIIHICVIIFYRFSHHTSFFKNRKNHFVSITNFLGLTTIMVISVIILTGAFYTVQLSIAEKHSSINFIKHHMGIIHIYETKADAAVINFNK